MTVEMIGSLAFAAPVGIFAAYLAATGRRSLARARALTVETALGDVAGSLRDLRRDRAAR